MRKLVLFLVVVLAVAGGVVAMSLVAPTLVQTYILTPVNSVTSTISKAVTGFFSNPAASIGTVIGSLGGLTTLFSYAWKKASEKKAQAQALLTEKQQNITTQAQGTVATLTEQNKQLQTQLTTLQSTSVEQVKAEYVKASNEWDVAKRKLEDQLRQARTEREAFKNLFEKAQEKLPQEIHVE